MGTVAGFPNVTVDFVGTITSAGLLTGLYNMGAGGELFRKAILFNVNFTDFQLNSFPDAFVYTFPSDGASLIVVGSGSE